ncbi:MAG: LON peptidase substrate-binding domain-containing protein [Gammaproteobacteria bacterium]|nr:LON peptidase substrate-binding domain-containing protein [Gammaproteobacteria bacterium]MBI5615396.1 LON peptidase substrate-binding domain-containing protein [Gammaproteobacteria bacterium]
MSALALFPLHTVLYPGGTLPLKIFEARYVDLVSACLRDDAGFGVAPILRGREVGMPAETHPIGTIARITDWDQGEDGLLHVTALGTARFRISSVSHRPNGLIEAQIEHFDDGADPALSAAHAHLAELFDALWQQFAPLRPSPAPLAARSLCYRLAELLPFEPATRVAVLAAEDVELQLRLVEREIRAIFR